MNNMVIRNIRDGKELFSCYMGKFCGDRNVLSFLDNAYGEVGYIDMKDNIMYYMLEGKRVRVYGDDIEISRL